MENFLEFSCCRKIIDLEKIVNLLIETYGIKSLQANIEQLKSTGINITCPFCRAICWIEPPPSGFTQIIDTYIPNTH